MLSAKDALHRLIEGNARFVEQLAQPDKSISRQLHLAGQHPFAVVMACSDSRVPVEMIFDEGLGELFVIRVAGNIIAPSIIGSVEFAVEYLGTRLVVVMGHTQCGAIAATLQQLQKPAEKQSRNLQSIVDRIRPGVEGLLHGSLQENPEELAVMAMRTNVGVSVSHLRYSSPVLERAIEHQGLRIVGAQYDVDSGQVSFLDRSMPRDLLGTQ